MTDLCPVDGRTIKVTAYGADLVRTGALYRGGERAWVERGGEFRAEAFGWHFLGRATDDAALYWRPVPVHPAPTVSIPMPWDRPGLAGWSIVGMNHYTVDGERRLFVAMVRGTLCVRAEGAVESRVFDDLAARAGVHA